MWAEHLFDETTYRIVPNNQVGAKITAMKYKLDSFLCAIQGELPENELIFFSRLKKQAYDKLISKFYGTAKVHKDPWKMRPAVATCGTFFHGLSRWADVYLQQLKFLSPAYLGDSYELLAILEDIGKLPEGTRAFTMDATAMYTNIDSDHGLLILKMFIEKFRDQIPDDFPVELILWAMDLVMRNNLFEFGPKFIEQLCGTAMGTPSACMYATIYYAFHEIFCLLKKYEAHLILYKRLIDDGFGLWHDRGDPGAWDRFCYDVNNFPGGKLKWVIEERSREVNFLDLTIKINDLNEIETRTYQKPMNLYLYLTGSSAHPKGVMKGMIFGEMRRYKKQNTKRGDYLKMVGLLFKRLKARQWSPALLREWILDAANKLESNAPRTREDVDPKQRLFVHMKYHPKGITRQQVRAAFDKTCDSFSGTRAAVEQMTVALSRPRNLKDELTSARFYPAEGAGST